MDSWFSIPSPGILDHGRLSLIARKGHKAHFDRETGGIWRRDAKEGKALSLRPM